VIWGIGIPFPPLNALNVSLTANRLFGSPHALDRVWESGGPNGSVSCHLLVVDLINERADINRVLERLRTVACQFLFLAA
jgi:hypothetical protein